MYKAKLNVKVLIVSGLFLFVKISAILFTLNNVYLQSCMIQNIYFEIKRIIHISGACNLGNFVVSVTYIHLLTMDPRSNI